MAGGGVVVLDVESDGLGSAQATDEQHGKHGGISSATGGVVGEAGSYQAADLAVLHVATGREARAWDACEIHGPGQVLAVHEAEAPGLSQHAAEGGQVSVGGRRRAVLGQPGPQRLGMAVAELVPGDGDGQRRAGLAPAGPLIPAGRAAVDQELGEELQRRGHRPAGLGRGHSSQVHGHRVAGGGRCGDRWDRGAGGLERGLHDPPGRFR